MAVVEPTVGDGEQPEVCVIEGRLWACEWSGQPSTAEVTVDGRLAFVKEFGTRGYPPTTEPWDRPLGQRNDWR